MPWFRVDDHFHDHRKRRRSNLRAIGLWTCAGSWAGDNLTDGFVPSSELGRWGATTKDANVLIAAGLWERAEVEGEKGYQFHDWPDFNPTKAEVLADRKANADRVRDWRRRKEQERKDKGDE